MDLILRRVLFRQDGILGELYSPRGEFWCETIEHAYEASIDFVPKLPPGVFLCKRGTHKLEHMEHPFETFEITNVPGHTNILFHVGNYNHDSDGCLLVGEWDKNSKVLKLLESRDTFERFMSIQDGYDEFTLTVLDQDVPMV